MSKSLSFLEAVIARAKQKTQAAQARRRPSSATEKPRDVILRACELIAEQLALDGFAYLKSAPRLKRTEGDLTFSIHFQSDRNNCAGRRAAVWIHAGVCSAELARWRRAHPMPWGGSEGPDAGSVTGGQIGNLTADPTWLEWDFANPSCRAEEIDDAVRTIKRVALPFFALFDDPSHAVEQLVHYRALRETSLLEYALVAVGRDAAEAAGREYLRRNPVIRTRFDAAIKEFAAQGLPRFSGDTGRDLAALALHADLDISPRSER